MRSPPFSLRNSRASEMWAPIKITLREKGEKRWGERKMRDCRQSPSFWPFRANWFWSVKFLSPFKSIKHLQWDSFSHWAVIALVIGKLHIITFAWMLQPTFLIIIIIICRRQNDGLRVKSIWILLFCLFSEDVSLRLYFRRKSFSLP